jgi:hypothetical protein
VCDAGTECVQQIVSGIEGRAPSVPHSNSQDKGVKMGRLLDILGFCVLALLLGHFFQGHGQDWVCGRYGMPRSLVAEDGKHHPSGEEIDSITLGLITNDCEEEVFLVALSIIALALGYTIFESIRVYRRRLRTLKLIGILDMIEEKQRQGQDAEELLKCYEKLSGKKLGKK